MVCRLIQKLFRRAAETDCWIPVIIKESHARVRAVANAVGRATALVTLNRMDHLMLQACLRKREPPNDQVRAAAVAFLDTASRRLAVSTCGTSVDCPPVPDKRNPSVLVGWTFSSHSRKTCVNNFSAAIYSSASPKMAISSAYPMSPIILDCVSCPAWVRTEKRLVNFPSILASH